MKTEDYKKFNTDGSLANETITITSADGSTIDTTNKDGNGNILSTSTDVTTTDSTGIKTEDYQEFNADGLLANETITTTSADGSWTDSQISYDGNGGSQDNWTASDGSSGG